MPVKGLSPLSSELFTVVKCEVLTSAPAVCCVCIVLLRWIVLKLSYRRGQREQHGLCVQWEGKQGCVEVHADCK